MLRIGIMAYEASADRLGEGLLKELRQRLGPVAFEGVVGERMQQLGCHNLFAPQGLAVMGLFEVLRHLPYLLRVRRQLRQHFLASRPDLFIGIDAPDFNLHLERRLRRQGIPTVHYVSPSFWAWRQGRVKLLTEATDLVLSIFPFEVEFLRQHGVNAHYVGHPLAHQIPLQVDQQTARKKLGLALEDRVLAVLPGSRSGEIKRLTVPFMQALHLVKQRHPQLRLLLPVPGPVQKAMVEQQLKSHDNALEICWVDDSHQAMAAADLVLAASGTATIEALMHKRPMVVAYRLNPLSYAILSRLVKVRWIAMANLLAGEELAPEFVQQRCQPRLLADALISLLEDGPRRQRIAERYAEIHAELRLDSARLAADAVIELLSKQNAPVH